MKKVLLSLLIAPFLLLSGWGDEPTWKETAVYAAELGDGNNANSICTINVLMSPQKGIYTVDGNIVHLIQWNTTNMMATKTEVKLPFDIHRITASHPTNKKEEPEISGEEISPFMKYIYHIDRYRFTTETRQIYRRRFFQTYGKAFILPWNNKPTKTLHVKYPSATIDITSCCPESRNGIIPVFFQQLKDNTWSFPALGLVSLKTGDLEKIGNWEPGYTCENNGSIAWLNDYQLVFVGVSILRRNWGIFDLRSRKIVAGGELAYIIKFPDNFNKSYMEEFFIKDGIFYGIQVNDEVKILYQSEKKDLQKKTAPVSDKQR